MKKIYILFFVLFASVAFAQEIDTTIYKFVDEMPRFPGCEQLDTTDQAKIQCAQANLLLFFNRNIVYPLDARDQDIEGQVVITFIVEKDGLISRPSILKDIGGGCGDEAIRVAMGMNNALKEANLKWKPGVKAGKTVRTQVSVPIKFKLQDPPDFVMINYVDSLYVVVDDSVAFRDGKEALQKYLDAGLEYPEIYKDSCFFGSIDMTVLTRPDGYVRVIDLADYWNLGIPFQWEAIRTATSTWGQWIPAKRKGREVPSSYDLSVTFKPDKNRCAAEFENFEKANRLADEGSNLFNEGDQEAGIAKLSEAIGLFPENANFLYLRGQAYMNMDKMSEACEDFKKVRSIVSIGMVDQLIPLICK